VSAELKDTTCRTCRSQLGLDDSDEANGGLEALFVISITLGLRPGELRKLTWDHVDLDRGSGPRLALGEQERRHQDAEAQALARTPEARDRRTDGAQGNGVPIQEISDTVGHKCTHVTGTVYRHGIVPEIRGGATVMDDVFGDD
jgi:hypothetical protein